MFNVEKNRGYWNRNVWREMTGAGFGAIDLVGVRFFHMWQNTQLSYYRDQRPCSIDEVRATAEVLLTSELFNGTCEPRFGFAGVYVCKDKSSIFEAQQYKYLEKPPTQFLAMPSHALYAGHAI